MQDSGIPASSLQNLQDIVLPAPVPWWPPAPGWYVLAALIVLAISWYGFHAIRRYHRNRYRRAALTTLNELQASGDASACRDIPELLKRTALAVYPRSEVASISGEDWLSFLEQHAGKSRLDKAAGALLQRAAYQPEPLNEAEVSLLFASAGEWIKHHSNQPC